LYKENIMRSKMHVGTAGVLVVAASLLAGAAFADEANTSLPPEHQAGDVGYITGGVGSAEAKAFESAMPRHRLAIEVVEHMGSKEAFTADAMVKITDRRGNTLLDAQADGPFMLVDLPPGRYEVSATLGDRTLVKRTAVVSSSGLARATFEFPRDTAD
jgi:hypothetical protein